MGRHTRKDKIRNHRVQEDIGVVPIENNRKSVMMVWTCAKKTVGGIGENGR